jgi:hypothetical protein
MSIYEKEFSSFPTSLIKKHNFKNIDDNIAVIINQINLLRSQGLYSKASEIINDNKDLLSQYIIDAVTYRTWEEEIYNTQIYSRQRQQIVFFDEEEPECLEGDIWIGGVSNDL